MIADHATPKGDGFQNGISSNTEGRIQPRANRTYSGDPVDMGRVQKIIHKPHFK